MYGESLSFVLLRSSFSLQYGLPITKSPFPPFNNATIMYILLSICL